MEDADYFQRWSVVIERYPDRIQLIVDIMLQMIQERFGLSDDQLDEFVADFIGRLPISYQHALRLKTA